MWACGAGMYDIAATAANAMPTAATANANAPNVDNLLNLTALDGHPSYNKVDSWCHVGLHANRGPTIM